MEVHFPEPPGTKWPAQRKTSLEMSRESMISYLQDPMITSGLIECVHQTRVLLKFFRVMIVFLFLSFVCFLCSWNLLDCLLMSSLDLLFGKDLWIFPTLEVNSGRELGGKCP